MNLLNVSIKLTLLLPLTFNLIHETSNDNTTALQPISTCGTETKATRDEANDLAPVLWEPGDGEGHGDDGDDGQGEGAHHPIHTGQQPHPDPGERGRLGCNI